MGGYKEGKSVIREGAEKFSRLAKKCAYCFDPLDSPVSGVFFVLN